MISLPEIGTQVRPLGSDGPVGLVVRVRNSLTVEPYLRRGDVRVLWPDEPSPRWCNWSELERVPLRYRMRGVA